MNNSKVVKNASWIIVCRVVQSIVSLVIGSITARYLGPSNYGLINYASSLVAFVVPIMQLGLSGILVREIVNAKPEEEGEILGTALVLSFASSLLCIVGIMSFVWLMNGNETETIIVCALHSIVLVFQALEMIQYWFQAKLKSKYTSITMLVAYVVVSIYKVYLLVKGKSVYMFALSQVIDYFIIAVVLIVLYNRQKSSSLRFSIERAKNMFSRSKYYIISGMMVAIFAQTDKIMLKNMIDDSAAGFYAAACTCAGVTGFVFNAIIDSLRPKVLESKNVSQEAFEFNVTRFYSVIIYFSLIQCIGITIFAELIVKILYGEQYFASVNVLRLIVWYSTFSYLGSVRNVWILAEEKQKYLWVINLSGALTNVALNFIFIPIWGIMGAAFASLVTQIFTNVVMGFIIKPIRKNNILMIKGLNPKRLFEILR